jgi:hypothetical protein
VRSSTPQSGHPPIPPRRVAERLGHDGTGLLDLVPLAGGAASHLHPHLYWRRLERTSQMTITSSTRLAAKVLIIQA